MHCANRMFAAALVLLAWTQAGSGPAQVDTLEIWLRRPAPGPAGAAKGNLITLDLKGMKNEELETYDIQYERNVKVRGVHLRDLIAVFKPLPEHVDEILLHTTNGMIVPVSLARLRKDIQVFIAFEIWSDGKWTKDFPKSVHIEANGTKEIPTTFHGNKIVVGKEWRATENGFTPWRHLDALIGVEFIESGAYYDEFQSAKASKAGSRGQVVFAAQCQYCHAVNGLGATRAPPLTNVTQAFGKDGWKKVYDQVLAPGAAGMYPHFMPAQKNFKRQDAKDLITWLESLRGSEMTPYDPSYKMQVKWTD